MKIYSNPQSLLKGVCLLIFLGGITGESSNCNTPKLGPKDVLSLTVFDSQDKITPQVWDNLCEAIRQFPQGLITLDYRAGAQATGSVDNIQCGGGSCKGDLINECMLLNSQNINDCFKERVFDDEKQLQCYCKQDINAYKNLLENAALRASWSVPENAFPVMAVNQTYDPCIKFGSYEEILNYFCLVYQKQVGKCG